MPHARMRRRWGRADRQAKRKLPARPRHQGDRRQSSPRRADYLERLAKFFLQLALPLKTEVRWRDDQRPLHETSDLQLLEEQARHDRLPGTGVVGEEEPDAWQSHEIVVNGFELVRQWVDTRDGEGKVWVVLVSEPETCGFDAKAEARRIAVERLALGRRIEKLELVEAQDTLVDLSSLLTCTNDFDYLAERCDDEYLDGLGKHRPADDDACFSSLAFISSRRCRHTMVS